MRSKKYLSVILMAGALVMGYTGLSQERAAVAATPAPNAVSSTTPIPKVSPKKQKKLDLNGIYHATLGFETYSSRSVYRYGYYDTKSKKSSDWNKAARGIKGTSNYQTVEGKFNEVKIKGNGTYSVKATNVKYHYASRFKLLQVSTDIPKNKKIKFSNLQVLVNGQTKLTLSKIYQSNTKKQTVLLALDNTRSELANLAMQKRIVPSSYTTANTVEIRFTVSGFNYRKGDPVPTATPATTPVITATPEASATVQPSQTPSAAKSSDIKNVNNNTSSKTDSKLTNSKKAGIVVTILVAISGVIACLVVVNKRKR